MGDTGPCGRCSEIYFFRGASVPCGEELAGRTCRGVECSCDRYVEIWNNVFMEFDRQADGKLIPLPAPSIDTGMGFERVTAVLQGHLSNYDTDLFTPILSAIGERAGTTHRGTMEPSDVSMRVVADHLRAMTFLIADGVVPSNEWRGYVLRKIMRRAMRHGKQLGLQEPFLHTMVDTMVREFGDAYPELKTGRDIVAQVIRTEEERFDAVLTSGLPRLEEILDKAAAGNGLVPGEAAFKLYDTHGVPRDFIEDMIETRKLRLDQEGFDRAMEAQREKARAKSAFKGSDAKDATWTASDPVRAELESTGDKAFRGYETTKINTQILAIFNGERQEVPSLIAGQDGYVALTETPFYLEAGGQVSDAGTIAGPRGEARVTAVVRTGNWPRLHGVHVTSGELSRRDLVSADVSARSTGRDPPQPHSDSPAPCRASTSAGPARQAGGLSGCARPAALRLRARQRRHSRAIARDRAHRQRTDPAKYGRADGREEHAGGDRRRRDGAVRREVRRQGPRRLGSWLQRRAVRRDSRARDWRHRPLRHRL